MKPGPSLRRRKIRCGKSVLHDQWEDVLKHGPVDKNGQRIWHADRESQGRSFETVAGERPEGYQ